MDKIINQSLINNIIKLKKKYNNQLTSILDKMKKIFFQGI